MASHVGAFGTLVKSLGVVNTEKLAESGPLGSSHEVIEGMIHVDHSGRHAFPSFVALLHDLGEDVLGQGRGLDSSYNHNLLAHHCVLLPFVNVITGFQGLHGPAAGGFIL
jgi:hypothetical protein